MGSKPSLLSLHNIAFCSPDEEDSLFAPPKLTDEDFSPFGSRGGLFSGGQGLFDDEDEEVSGCAVRPSVSECIGSKSALSLSGRCGFHWELLPQQTGGVSDSDPQREMRSLLGPLLSAERM